MKKLIMVGLLLISVQLNANANATSRVYRERVQSMYTFQQLENIRLQEQSHRSKTSKEVLTDYKKLTPQDRIEFKKLFLKDQS